MSVALAATLAMAHLQRGPRSQTLPSLALAPRTEEVVSGEDEVVGSLEDEGDLSTMTIETGITIHAIGHQIVHTAHAVARPYGATVIFETSGSSTGETVMIAGSPESTTRT